MKDPEYFESKLGSNVFSFFKEIHFSVELKAKCQELFNEVLCYSH